eukprot:scaffold369_cov177-Ochromonas_danica.AAC.30
MFRRSFCQARNASVLVLAEHDGVKGVTSGTLSAVTAASQISKDITLLILGKNLDAVSAQAAKVSGVSKVKVVDSDVFARVLPEDAAEVVKQISADYTHILAPSTNNTKNYIPRAAALTGSAPLTDVISVIKEDTFKRPVYAGNAISTVQMTSPKKFILIRTTAFEKAPVGEGNAAVEKLNLSLTKNPKSTFVKASAAVTGRVELETARVVVSGGRGLKNGDNFKLLDDLAAKLGGAVGASRAAVDAGFVPNDYQVGQTGKVVAPDLYIAVGISGAIQHLSGMKDSKTIVAINTDKEAPIFQVADYGLVEDLFKAVPELTSKL